MDTKTRVLIADDHPVLRRGLAHVIDADPAFQIVAEADDGEIALSQLESLGPSIAILDIDMPRMDGLAAAREIRRRKLPVDIMFLTIHADEDCFNAAMDLGARSYILKESAVAEILRGLRAMAAGEYFVSSSLMAHLVNRRSREQSLSNEFPGLGQLTPAERRVLRGIADGKSSKEIGAQLFINFRTVENHRASICQKLGLHGPHSLFKFALQNRTVL